MINRLLQSSALFLTLAKAGDCELKANNKFIGMSDFEIFSDEQALGTLINEKRLRMINLELCRNDKFPLTGMRIDMGVFDPSGMTKEEEITLSHIGLTSEKCEILNLDYERGERIVLLNVHFINEP